MGASRLDAALKRPAIPRIRRAWEGLEPSETPAPSRFAVLAACPQSQDSRVSRSRLLLSRTTPPPWSHSPPRPAKHGNTAFPSRDGSAPTFGTDEPHIDSPLTSPTHHPLPRPSPAIASTTQPDLGHSHLLNTSQDVTPKTAQILPGLVWWTDTVSGVVRWKAGI